MLGWQQDWEVPEEDVLLSWDLGHQRLEVRSEVRGVVVKDELVNVKGGAVVDDEVSMLAGREIHAVGGGGRHR